MSEHPNRDTIAENVELRERVASIVAFAGGSVRTRAQDRAAADNLFAAGLIVPPGLTAEKLSEIANWMDTYDELAHSYFDLLDKVGFGEKTRLVEGQAIVAGKEIQADLREWATALREG